MTTTIEQIAAPSTSTERIRQSMAQRGKEDLFYLASVVLKYNRLQVHTHGPLCRFFDTCPYMRRIFLMPRTHFKTSIITISGTIQDIINDPDERILVAAATHDMAKRFLEEIKRHFTNNQLFQWLYPEVVWSDIGKAPRWNKEEMEVPRSTYVREPTVDTIGARGEVISRHYTKIRLDDIIGENEFRSDAEMQKTIEWLGGVESLLVPPFDKRPIDIVGTRWKLDDVYSFAEFIYGGGKRVTKRALGPHAHVVGERLAVFSRRDLENGKPIFPEEFSIETLENIRKTDPIRYAAQYANDPLASGVAEFALPWLKYYSFSESGHIILEDSETPIDPQTLPLILVCDPSVGEKRTSDRSALHVIGIHRPRSLKNDLVRLIMLDSVVAHLTPDVIVQTLFDLYKKWPWIHIASVETNAFQKALKYWVEQREAVESRWRLPIVEFTGGSVRNKVARIKGLQPAFRAGQVYLQAGFTEFIEEYQRWHPTARYDDAMDALSQILEYVDFGFTKASMTQIELWNKWVDEQRNALTGYT